jgi:2-oxoglutarate dehydrogenase E1 component
MGAWTYVEPRLRELAPEGVEVVYVGRPERASPAEGYPAAHAAEQGRIIREALETGDRRSPEPLPTVAAAGEAEG